MKLVAILLSSCLMLSLAFPASGQDKKDKVFFSVPANSRVLFVKRLRLYVRYESKQQYVKWAEMLSENTFANRKRPPKSEFVEYEKKSRANKEVKRLRGFSVTSLQYSTALEAYEIRGIASYGDKNNLTKAPRLIYAWYHMENWYFSFWLEEIVD